MYYSLARLRLFGAAYIIFGLLLATSFLQAQTGVPLASTTTGEYRKSNQSKVFYYDGIWWAYGFHEAQAKWYLWKYTGIPWTKTNKQEETTNYTIDAVIDTVNNKLYTFASHQSKPRFRRYGYTGSGWVKELQRSNLQYFVHPNKPNPACLVQGKDGRLWVFRTDGSNNLQTMYSDNFGSTWSPAVTIKSGLNTAVGTADAVAFSMNGDNYVGVGYAEEGAANSQYGFLIHRDGDADNLWSDESNQLTFFGAETALNDICMSVDGSHQVYMFVRTSGGSPSDPRNTLYKRNTAGAWTAYRVNNIGDGPLWTSPAIAIDGENQMLYLIGRNTVSAIVEYKAHRIGEESTLLTAPVDTLFASGADQFATLSVPAGLLNSTTGLMAVSDNATADDLWFNLLTINPGTNLTISEVTVDPDTTNTNAAYAVDIITSASGAMLAGVGEIHLRFPNNTTVPAGITAATITVNGTPATTVSSNAATRELTIVTPVDIPASDTFFVAIAKTAGLINPSAAGDYTLEAWTSVQPAPVTSPFYTLYAINSIVSSAKVKLFPADADSASQYTIGFRVGPLGGMLSGSSTFLVNFPTTTQVTEGALSGVTVNTVNASANGNSLTRNITITLPASVTINNSDSVTLFIPTTAIINPSYADTFNLKVSTSVEPTQVMSHGYIVRIGRLVANTTRNLETQNQSKVFYHGGFWWAVLQDKPSKNWYLYKRADTTWTQSLLISDNSKVRPDCVLDAPNNRVYILMPGPSTANLARLSFASGSWSMDSGFPKAAWGQQVMEMNLVRAKNGDLWAFFASDSTLWGRRSEDDGDSWEDAVIVKDSLNNGKALTDAVAFTYSGNNYVGVGYAENNNSISVYGFLRHRDGQPDTVWTDETSSVEQFSNTEADDHINMLVHNEEIFMTVKTSGGGGSAAKNGLLHRATDGTWTAYAINFENGWTRPVGAIDATNGVYYAIGTREGSHQIGEMKSVSFEDYGALASAVRDTIFDNGFDDFFDSSAPAHVVTGASDLILLANNTTRDQTWAQFIHLPGAALAKPITLREEERQVAQTAEHLNEQDVIVAYPNPFNPQTQIRFRLKEAAAVKLQIFNVNGQLVKTLVNGKLAAGVHERQWNARNHNGIAVASGTYLYRLQIDGQAITGRLHYIK